ncbi:hypothetical protein ACFL4T_04670 [candidate division KSB1 bacterium]
MKKIASNIKYKMKYQSVWAAWYLGIYLFIMMTLYLALIKTSLISSSEGSFVFRLWGAAVVQFAFTLRFREDFDFFLTYSNTRVEIFQSLLGTAIGFSGFYSGIIVLEKLTVDSLNNVFGFHNINDPFHFFSPYAADNIYLLFIFFFVLIASCSIFGLLLGSLFYRFGRAFTVAFWLLVSLIPVVLLPLILWYPYPQSDKSGLIANIGEFLKNFDVLTGSGFLFILAVIFGAAAYLNIRSLPQKSQTT